MLDLSIHFPDEDNIFQKKACLSENALTVLRKRYLRRDLDGKVIEEPEDMFSRVAKTIAEVDRRYDPHADISATARIFYEMMVGCEFMPNSPTLMNAGRYLGQLSACFVLPVEDSMENIFETLKNTALIHKSGGGTGFSFSRIRPANDVVHSTVGISSGPISFMKVYDAATETVKQGGTRRGANMGILRIDHPDILDFISCKADLNKLNNFNISVALTEDFMNAVEADEEYSLRNPRNGSVVEKLNAREVFDKIVHQAWATGEPGIVFLDRINRDNPTPHIGEIESTNPCGEQPLLPYESCNLGSINLSRFVTDGGEVDYINLRRIIRNAVHFLDNVIDANNYPLPEIEKNTLGNRKIGLGVMGFADMLFTMGIPYNSVEAIDVAENIMAFIQNEGYAKSAELAAERGVFPNFEGSVFDHPDSVRVRNATVTTIAPTGTISIISGCSGGIEPVFALAYERNVMSGTRMLEINPVFEAALKKAGIYSEDLMRRIIEEGSIAKIEEIPKDIRRVFVTSHDITPEWHIKLQGAFQKYTDNAVSKTVNFPNEATEEDVREVYMLAYHEGCKGVTIYRDGSRNEQVMSIKKEDKTEIKAEKIAKPEHLTKRPRPVVTRGATYKVAAGCGNLYITINEDDDGPFELFTHLGKSGGCAQSWSEAISRLASLGLRSGIAPEEIVDQLKGIACPSPVWDRGEMIKSCADGISKALNWYVEASKKTENSDTTEESEMASVVLNAHIERSAKFELAEPSNSIQNGETGTICPDCGARLFYEEGCQKCHSCGFSKCG
ncbi:ribonucleotide-diphosphate reductase subunit alpha [bacterium]|nr:MAG: ribonucleotide-diphosphate reductase subunit alpha [bacterium]